MTRSTSSTVELVSSEVMRKLRLAGEADTVEDREIVCEEVFLDVSGILDEAAQAQLGAPQGCPFYVVLAHYYASPKGADTAVAVMDLLQSVYGQGYAAPLVALLLHRWLLLRRSPGRGVSEEQRARLANVMALGTMQLFVGDIQSGASLFFPMWRTICYEVVLGELHSAVVFKSIEPPTQSQQQQSQDAAEPVLGYAAPGLVALPPAARNSFIAAAAAPLPYYGADSAEVKGVLQRLPPPGLPLHPVLESSVSLPLQHTQQQGQNKQPPQQQQQRQQQQPPLFVPGAGADFALTEITDTLSRIRSEAGLLRYLTALRSLKGDPVLLLVRPTTRLKLQSELYALTSPGGPHYPPKAVQVAALGVLDHLFPANQTTRNVMRWIFRALHPTDWLGGALLVPVLMAFFWCLYSLIVFRRTRLWGSRASEQVQGHMRAQVSPHHFSSRSQPPERSHHFSRSLSGGQKDEGVRVRKLSHSEPQRPEQQKQQQRHQHTQQQTQQQLQQQGGGGEGTSAGDEDRGGGDVSAREESARPGFSGDPLVGQQQAGMITSTSSGRLLQRMRTKSVGDLILDDQ